MANKEIQMEIKGKSGDTYTFFPQYSLLENRDSKGAGIYVFIGENNAIEDIQFLAEDAEVTSTLQRLKADGAAAFYFKDTIDEAAANAMIDDIKDGDEYRRKSD